ncbi:DASS family sodium-coupled anion symporter [Zunongwangia sp. F260]|uniref:DASS family sodium-coupled anion symporter n=1 Tax=Autumnicola lenta TaxID=3075593 RepID=A0ABU3CP48_9FLAO|nr:DASS family sodium-coupled anion symporter [Zunongwangia sp. F260]MDT0648012.1 DASS family sodium-coupled anion symporter [Zunongwangia sp. F260]
MRIKRNIFLVLGPVLYLVLQELGAPQGMPESAFDILCATLWMAIWWVSEAVPIAVTALLPIILFPLSGAVDLSTTTASYGHRYIFLYMGGFILAIAIEKWNLHKRIALHILRLVGTSVSSIILGFMLATAFLSMWISNTATSVMMLPIGMSIVKQLQEKKTTQEEENPLFGKALMLSIAYSASIGGMATLIGTPPNLVLAGYVQEVYNIEITFWQWFKFGLPIAGLLLVICWLYLTRVAFPCREMKFPGGEEEISKLIAKLGPMGKEEKKVLAVFVLTAFCWITRPFLLELIFPNIDDTIIAMMAGIVLFTIPAKDGTDKIIKWEEAVKMPWGIILLFGGGMALASGFEITGLALWIGTQMTLLQALPLILLIMVIVCSVNFITELTSNLATTAMLLPILAPIAINLDLNPYLLLVGTTVAASCAFMLPVATPPNAVVFGSGYLRIADMVKTGLWMNIISIILLTAAVYFLLPLLWDFDPFKYPVRLETTPLPQP